MTGDPYAVLGVPRDAGAEKIKQAYEQRLAEAARNGAFKLAQDIDAAYTVLRDPRRRELFDRHGIVTQIDRGHPMERWSPPRPVPFRSWSPDEPTRRRRPRRTRRTASGAVVALLLIAGLTGAAWQLGVIKGGVGHGLVTDAWANDAAGLSATAPSAGPPVRRAAHPTRLRPQVMPPPGQGSHQFFEGNARFDPCQPIRYVISGNEPYAGATEQLMSAIVETSGASGLQFTYAGTTSETPVEHREPFQPTRYGKVWAPVLIAWTDPTVVHRLSGQVTGLGGGASADVRGETRLVSGIVYFDAPDMARAAQRRDGRTENRVIMLHELGHLVGLDHVTSKSEVMYPRVVPGVAHYSTGDLQGLAELGAAKCSHFVSR